jgi:N-methylhydantoinase A
VTDANVLLGYLDPDYFLGGRLTLDSGLARQAVERKVGTALNLRAIDAAWGVHTIVNENMARAARTHLIERNRDPRDVVMVAFGGAGPAHAVEVARILGITRVIVPLGAGVASAIGALTAPMSLPLVRSYMTLFEGTDWGNVRRLYDEMREEAQRAFADVVGADAVEFRYAADMRFAGQHHELRVEVPHRGVGPDAIEETTAAFRAAYNEVYGRAPDGLAVEILNWYLTAEVPRSVFHLAREPARAADGRTALKGTRALFFDRPDPGFRPCAVYDRYRLEPGAGFPGPCLVEEREATVVIPPDYRVDVDGYRNLVITATEDGQDR